MLQNYLKIAWRNIIKNRLFSFINILGLSVGMALIIMIFLYIQHERSYNQSIPDKEQVYRLYREYPAANSRKMAIVPAPVSPALIDEVPEIKSATRFSGIDEVLVQKGEESIFIDGFAIADSLFFQTVPLPLQLGDHQTVLQRPASAVLSAATAQQLFGRQNPVGQVLTINEEQQVTVTGVIAEPAGPSHFNAVNIIVSQDEFSPYWTGGHCEVYVKLNSQSQAIAASEKATAMANSYVKQEYLEDGDTPPSRYPTWNFQPLFDIHLHSTDVSGYNGKNGSLRQIGILLLLAFIVLLIACINYMNLATAKAAKRSKEVGIRKVSGATFGQMVSQFLSESLLQSGMALFLAILLADLALPFFNQLIDRDLSFAGILSSQLPVWLVILASVIGLIAGSYPAFYLSRIHPISTLKGALSKGKRGGRMRQSLVVLQFSLSIAMIIVVGFVWKQVNFMLNQDLGFSGDQVVVATLNTEEAIAKLRRTKSDILQQPGISAASVMARTPGQRIPNYGMKIEGQEKGTYINTLFADAQLAQALDLEVKAGRYFSEEIASDTARAFLVNEEFVRTYEIDNPIGHRMKFSFDEQYGEIIGVVKDFHYQGLQSALEPLVISAREDLAWFTNVAFKVDPTQVGSSLAAIEELWGTLEPQYPFRYSFLDEEFAQQYNSYERFGNTILMGTLLSIFVAILGLFGLSTFTIEQRTKEIGIRKVLGATVGNLVQLIITDFVKLVLIAGVLAIPLGYWFVNSWLQDFAYATSMGPMPFLLALLTAVLLAVVTVFFQTMRSSTANPVEALRYE
ncbi:MAG: ABC transporter permease [Saprospiraceae bacterium]|nr:ABC transporter permease [Saprospiraceae bacterium]